MDTKRRVPADTASIRAVVPLGGGAHFVMSGFPGLGTAMDGTAVIDPLDMEQTLDELLALDVKLLFVLTETAELPDGAPDALQAGLDSRGIRAEMVPIVDFSVPDSAFEARWQGLKAELDSIMDAGHALGSCCHYGAGRSGLLAARVLIDRGWTPSEAIKAVRREFDEAIESSAQVAWLSALA